MRTSTWEQQAAARVAGALYLATSATAVFSEMVVKGRLIVPGDALATARAVTGAERLFRLALASEVVTFAGVVALAWALHVVLSPACRHVARLALCLRLVEAAVGASCVTLSLLALRPLGGAAHLQAFDLAQRAVLSRLFLGAAATGMHVMFVILGLGSAAFAWAWLRSRYIPRPLAWLGLAGSLLLSAGSFATLVSPALGDRLGMSYMLTLGVFEVTLGAWLLVRGVRLPAGAPS
jgi:hypothetical protein